MTTPVPVNPATTRLRIVERIRALKVAMDGLPKDSREWFHLNGYSCGLYEAIQMINADIDAAALDAAGADHQGGASLN